MEIDKLIEVAENDGWHADVSLPNKYNSYIQIEFEKYTDFGNYDFVFSVAIESDSLEELVAEIDKYCKDFDPDEEASMWIVDGHGAYGAPYSLKDIIKSMVEAKRMALTLLFQMRQFLQHRINNISVFKREYKKALDEVIDAGNDESLPITATMIVTRHLDDNYYGDGYILFGKKRIDVESIMVDDEFNVKVHINCEAFECDVNLVDLSKKNAKRVMRLLYARYVRNVADGYYRHIAKS